MRLGMGDQELMGLALGLATALNDNPDELIPEVLGSATLDPADAAAERADADTSLMPSPLTD